MLDVFFMRNAYEMARDVGTDPSTQNGAVLVKNEMIVARGANRFPYGVIEHPERWERPIKYSFVEHAERDVIFAAARNGVSTVGTTMYCPWFACTDCARAIIQAGITEVVGHATPLHDDASQSWKDSIAIAFTMLDEAGVKTRFIDDEIGIMFRFNGVLSRA